MHLNQPFAHSIALVCMAVASHAADPNDATRDTYKNKTDSRSPVTRTESQLDRKEGLMFPMKASDIIGQEVQNFQNEKLGKVDELGLDFEAGRVTIALVNSGGVFGLGTKSMIVPPAAFFYDPSSKVLRLDMDKDKFKGAPEFEMSKWDEYSETNRLTETYRYYGLYPYYTQPLSADTRNNDRDQTTPDRDRTTTERDRPLANRDPKTPTENHGYNSRLGPVDKASKVIGMSVMSKDNKKYGKVDNLIVDLPAGRIVHVVVSSGGFLGIGDALNAVPPTSFRFSPSRDQLILDLGQDELTKAPYFKSSEWPDWKDSTYSGKVYDYYGARPYFNADADNTARNVRDRDSNRVDPLDQGNNEADLQTSRRIRREIIGKPGLSINARNVKIITANGKVTLRGPVNNSSEKQTIEEIANRLATGNTVDSQIEVKGQQYDKKQ